MHPPGLSVVESKELRRKAIFDDDLDDNPEVHGSAGDLTLDMLADAMPRRFAPHHAASSDSNHAGHFNQRNQN
jgi:hypothetical protein